MRFGEFCIAARGAVVGHDGLQFRLRVAKKGQVRQSHRRLA